MCILLLQIKERELEYEYLSMENLELQKKNQTKICKEGMEE